MNIIGNTTIKYRLSLYFKECIFKLKYYRIKYKPKSPIEIHNTIETFNFKRRDK